MLSRFSVGFLWWNRHLFLFVHLHACQRFFEALYDLGFSEDNLQRLVVPGRVVEACTSRFLFHGSVEHFSSRESAKVVNRDGISFLGSEIWKTQIQRSGQNGSSLNR